MLEWRITFMMVLHLNCLDLDRRDYNHLWYINGSHYTGNGHDGIMGKQYNTFAGTNSVPIKDDSAYITSFETQSDAMNPGDGIKRIGSNIENHDVNDLRRVDKRQRNQSHSKSTSVKLKKRHLGSNLTGEIIKAKIEPPSWGNLATGMNNNEPSSFLIENSPDTSIAWPTYGSSVVLPSPMFGLSIQRMRYIINPYMSKGNISEYKKKQFANDLQGILELITAWLTENRDHISNAPKVFEASPITSNFDINTLLAGVRNINFNQKDKKKFIETVRSAVANITFNQESIQITGNAIMKKYDKILHAFENDKYFNRVPNVKKILNSMSSGIPDAIYLANAGLNLGKSSLLNNRSIFIIQSPYMVERQVENAFTRVLSIQMGNFPIEMNKVYEGMADSVTALVNINGEKKKVLLGYNSSRSNPKVYQDIINLATVLRVVPDFPRDVVILEVNNDMKGHAYHMDVALLTLPNGVVCVGEGIFTLKSMKLLEELFDKVYLIPKKEWMRFALNSILIDERLGFTGKENENIRRFAIIPPSAPTLKNVLSRNSYEVVTQDLAYDKGGGYIRCLTLFANVDPKFIRNEKLNTMEEYRRQVKSIDRYLPSSILKTLHWNSDIHRMTEKLYGLKYKYESTYDADML